MDMVNVIVNIISTYTNGIKRSYIGPSGYKNDEYVHT